MAPSFNDLVEEDGTYDSEEELDFSGMGKCDTSKFGSLTFWRPDLREEHEVRLEQGLDAFVVVDGLPVVPEANKAKLVSFLTKKLNASGKVKEDGFYMPTNAEGKTEGYE